MVSVNGRQDGDISVIFTSLFFYTFLVYSIKRVERNKVVGGAEGKECVEEGG